MVTACQEDIDEVRGLGLGASDYIEKPFSPNVLLARIKTHIDYYNRLKEIPTVKNPILSIEEFQLNTDTHRVFVRGDEVALKNREYELLLFFMFHVDIIFDRETLYERI
ncbi:response regulator transcription factor [Clostridium sp. Marseille-Q7071]